MKAFLHSCIFNYILICRIYCDLFILDEEGMGRSERDILVAEANMPIEELISKYSSGVAPAPVPQLKKLQKEKHQSPMIKAKKDPGKTIVQNYFFLTVECWTVVRI